MGTSELAVVFLAGVVVGFVSCILVGILVNASNARSAAQLRRRSEEPEDNTDIINGLTHENSKEPDEDTGISIFDVDQPATGDDPYEQSGGILGLAAEVDDFRGETGIEIFDIEPEEEDDSPTP